MQFFSFGINHRQVSLEIRDRFAARDSALRELYRNTTVSEHAEYVIVSTCNRTECLLYGFESDVVHIQQALSKLAGEPWPSQAFFYQDEAAVMQLLKVTAGLDSLVVGDAQILGQVKDAYRIAVDEERVGAVLHRLMHTAFSAAKRVVTETNLTSGTASIAGTAAALASQYTTRTSSGISVPRCLVLGAGHMGKLVVEALNREGGMELSLTNRSAGSMEKILQVFAGVRPVAWSDRFEAIAASDAVIVATSAESYVIDLDELAALLKEKETLIVDVSVPRNVNPAVAELDGYRLYDLDVLQEKIHGVISHRKEEIPAAHCICEEMLADFVSWCFHHQALQPAISAILDTFDTIRKQEIERHARKFVDADLKQLDRITKSIMQKVLAVPVVRLKHVGPDHIDYVNGVKLLQTLFARNSCEGPDIHQLNHSEHMLAVISQPEAASLSSLANCPFDEEEAPAPSRRRAADRVGPAHRVLRLGTRGSALALWQANHVQHLLEAAGFVVEQERITTRGDQILDKPLALIEGKSLFTKELDVALIEGRIDLAVHSLKDLPSQLPEGLVLAAVSSRENPLDAFVAHPSYDAALEELPEGALIATSSLRRTAQLKAWRPDLQIVPVRGNVDTRLAKLDEGSWHGIVLAAAGLIRIGLADRIHTLFDPKVMLPAVGQGALGIVCAADNRSVFEALRETLHDPETASAVQSERAFLHSLEGSCHVPVGGYACRKNGGLILHGLVASLDGSEVVRGSERVDPDFPQEAGLTLAHRLLAEGAGEILQLIKL